MTKTEKFRIIDELIKEKGGTRKDYENLMNQIAYHESAHTMDPTISQLGGGPGRGKYQFEAWATDKNTGKKMPHGGGVVAARRTKTYYKRKDIPVPKWLEEASKGDNLDVTKLTSQQQDILFLGNMREHPTANFENVWSGKKTATEFWADNHWAGAAKDRDKRMKSFEKSQSEYNYNKVDQAKTPTLATPEPVKPRVKDERESVSTPAVSTAVASQPRIKEPYVSNIDNLTAYIKKIEDTPKPTSTRPGFKDYMKEDFNNLGNMIKNPVKYSDDWKTVGKTLLTAPIAKLFGIEDAGVEDIKSNKEYKAKMNDWEEYDKTMTTPQNQMAMGGSENGCGGPGQPPCPPKTTKLDEVTLQGRQSPEWKAYADSLRVYDKTKWFKQHYENKNKNKENPTEQFRTNEYINQKEAEGADVHLSGTKYGGAPDKYGQFALDNKIQPIGWISAEHSARGYLDNDLIIKDVPIYKKPTKPQDSAISRLKSENVISNTEIENSLKTIPQRAIKDWDVEQQVNQGLGSSTKKFKAQTREELEKYKRKQTIDEQTKTGKNNKLTINPNYYSEGGSMGGGNNVERELNSFNVGGTHENNPNGGVPQGVGNNGKRNTVEQDETSFMMKDGKYIFSNRLGMGGILADAKAIAKSRKRKNNNTRLT